MIKTLLRTIGLMRPEPKPDAMLAVADVVSLRMVQPHLDDSYTAMRIVYLANMDSLAKTGAPLFDDLFEAGSAGPVNARLLRYLRTAKPRRDERINQDAIDLDQVLSVLNTCERLRHHDMLSVAALCVGKGTAWAKRRGILQSAGETPIITLRDMMEERGASRD